MKLLRLIIFSLLLLNTYNLTSQVTCEFKWEYKTFPSIPLKTIHDLNGKNYLYTATKSGGLMIFDISGASPVLIKTFGVNSFNSLEVINLAQSGNYLYLALGNFFGTAGQKPGLGIVDVSNPADAKIVSDWVHTKKDKGSAIVIVDGSTAYLGAMTQGLIILDVSNKQNISFVSQIIPDQNFPRKNPSSSQRPNARGMAKKDNIIFLCYDAGGMRMIDVSDKANPKEISRYINQTLPEKQQAYNNILIDGNTAYAGVDYCGMEVLDISNPSAVTQKGWWNPWECEKLTNLWFNSGGHINEVELDKKNNLLFMSAGGSELKIIDVSNPSNPTEVGFYKTPGGKMGVWGVTLYENKVFLSYINSFIPFSGTWSGVRMVEWRK